MATITNEQAEAYRNASHHWQRKWDAERKQVAELTRRLTLSNAAMLEAINHIAELEQRIKELECIANNTPIAP